MPYTTLDNNSTSFSIGQCVNTGGPEHRLSSRMRLDGAADVLIGVTSGCSFYSQSDCQGTAFTQSSSLSLFQDTAGIWESISSSITVAGVSSSFCSFDLSLVAGTIFDAYLDSLTLDSFLFQDGFESGDVSKWSSSVP